MSYLTCGHRKRRISGKAKIVGSPFVIFNAHEQFCVVLTLYRISLTLKRTTY